MKAYLCWFDDGFDTQLLKIFTTRDKAAAYCDQFSCKDDYHYTVWNIE